MSLTPNVGEMSLKRLETTKTAIKGILRDDVFFGLELGENQRKIFKEALYSIESRLITEKLSEVSA